MLGALLVLAQPTPVWAESVRAARGSVSGLERVSAAPGGNQAAQIGRSAVMSQSERDALVRAILNLDLPEPRKLVSVPRSSETETFEERMSRNGWNPANPANRGFRNVEKIIERHELQQMERSLNPASRGDRG